MPWGTARRKCPELTASRACGRGRKDHSAAGNGFCPYCELKTCTPATRSAWLLGHFSTQTVRRDSLLVVGITPTGNRDAGKFAADATQLPTGCQPESLAKPARRRSHKATQPHLLTRRPSPTIIRLRQNTSQPCPRQFRPPS